MARRVLGVILLGLGLVFCVALAASMSVRNDSGHAASGVTIRFSESVRITSWDATTFLACSPSSGRAQSFTFSEGTIADGKRFRVNWSPSSAAIVSVVWGKASAAGAGNASLLGEWATAPSLDQVAKDPHVLTETYAVVLTSDDGQELPATITREMSNEAIPFWVDYTVDFAAPVRATWATDGRGDLPMQGTARRWDKDAVSALLIDDFSDADLVSNLGTTWSFPSDDPNVSIWELGETAYGYCIVMNDFGNWTRLPLGGVNLSEYHGLYLILGRETAAVKVAIDGTQIAYLPATGIELSPAVYKIPFTRVSQTVLQAASELDLTIDEAGIWDGVHIYQVGLYRDRAATVRATDETRRFETRFSFHSNAAAHDVSLYVEQAGVAYRYSERVDFPLHASTEIALGAPGLGSGETASDTWTASDGDSEDNSFAVFRGEGDTSSLTSRWPNVLDVVRQGSAGGSPTRFYSVLYWRDGCPLALRGTKYHHLWPSPDLCVETGMMAIEQGRQNGCNYADIEVPWYFGWPDAQGNFTLEMHPLNTPWDGDPRGDTLSDASIAFWVSHLHQLGMTVGAKLYPSVNNGDPALLSSFWGCSSGATDCFLCTQGFLYGKGNGWANVLNHYAEPFTRIGVDITFLGHEDSIFKCPASRTRPLYETVIETWRKAGYSGLLSYGLCDCCRGPDDSGVDPETVDYADCGIPLSSLDFVGIDEYRSIARTASDTTDEMTDNVLSRVMDYLQRLHDVWGKPVFITESGSGAVDGIATTRIMMTDAALVSWRDRDDEEQRRVHTALLRACSFAVEGLGYDWLQGLCIGAYLTTTPCGYLPWGGPEMNVIGWYVNLKPRLNDTIRAFFRACPAGRCAQVTPLASSPIPHALSLAEVVERVPWADLPATIEYEHESQVTCLDASGKPIPNPISWGKAGHEVQEIRVQLAQDSIAASVDLYEDDSFGDYAYVIRLWHDQQNLFLRFALPSRQVEVFFQDWPAWITLEPSLMFGASGTSLRAVISYETLSGAVAPTALRDWEVDFHIWEFNGPPGGEDFYFPGQGRPSISDAAYLIPAE